MNLIGRPLINSLAKQALKIEFGFEDQFCFIPTYRFKAVRTIERINLLNTFPFIIKYLKYTKSQLTILN